MFPRIVPLLLLILSCPCQATTTYGASCSTDSSCDAHQKCVSAICRCNPIERRFWTGDTCAICAREYSVTAERCYRYFNDLKTWSAARAHCRAQYADLFTWRNNHDEQFIRPVVQHWASSGIFSTLWFHMFGGHLLQSYLSWSGATVTSLNPFATKWVDTDGLKLELTSKQWCDPTKHAGYTASREPTRENKKGPNGTENEECVTYNFGSAKTDLLCLADDYCSKTYPFICEMNAASMKLALATHHGDNGGDTSSGSGSSGGEEIDFERPPPPPPTETKPDGGVPSALTEKSGFLSNTNIMILAGVGVVLIVGAIAGYIVIQKKKTSTRRNNGRHGSASQGRPSFASSVGSMVDE